MDVQTARKRAIFLGFGTGFALGLGISALIATTVSWGILMKRQKDLAAEWQPAMAVVVTEELRTGEKVRQRQLAARAVPKVLLTPNSVLPEETDALAGSAVVIDLSPGDILTRSAVGLGPR